jgi:O-antigen ligase/polysaccharide polymerase Wzy-like membrane protein
MLAGAERPSRVASVWLLALGGLAAWTAASWLWSESAWRALEEAQRVTLYAVVGAAVVLNRRRIPVRAAVVTAVAVVVLWNIVARGTAPIGYANGLALLCVLGIVAQPRSVLVVPFAVILFLQDSFGAYAALAVGLAVFMAPRLRVAVAVLGVALLLASPFVAGGHERTHYWRVAAREAHAHPVLGTGAGTFVNWWVRERDTTVQTQEAHSLYVETLAELGPLGLALLLAVLAVPIAVARQREHAAVIAAYAAGAAVDFHWELAGVTLPMIVVAAAAVSEGRARPTAPLRVLVPACAALVVASLLAYTGNAALSAAQDAAQRGDFASAQSHARAAHRWQPYSPQPWVVLGDTATAAARVGAYRHAVDLDPKDWSLWQRLAGAATGELRRLA